MIRVGPVDSKLIDEESRSRGSDEKDDPATQQRAQAKDPHLLGDGVVDPVDGKGDPGLPRDPFEGDLERIVAISDG